MTNPKLLRYGEQQIRSFALTGESDVLINAAPMQHLKPFIQAGVTANKQYWWELRDDIEVKKLIVIFPVNSNPSGRITLSIHPSVGGTPEFEIEFAMNQTLAENAYTADLSIFPPISKEKWGKLVSTVNADQIIVVGEYCHIYNPQPPNQII